MYVLHACVPARMYALHRNLVVRVHAVGASMTKEILESYSVESVRIWYV